MRDVKQVELVNELLDEAGVGIVYGFGGWRQEVVWLCSLMGFFDCLCNWSVSSNTCACSVDRVSCEL